MEKEGLDVEPWNSFPKGTWLQSAMLQWEARSSHSALPTSPITSTSDSRGCASCSQPSLGRMLQALHSAGQKQCTRVQRTHGGASSLGDIRIYFIGALGEFKQHNDDNDDDDSGDNTGQV